MNIGDSADIDPDLLTQTGYSTQGARCLSKKMDENNNEPGIISKILGKNINPAQTGQIGIIVPDDNVISDILDGRSYRYVDGSYQRPEDILEFFDNLASSESSQTPELVFTENVMDGLRERYDGGDFNWEFQEVREALDDMGTIINTKKYWDGSVQGSQRGDAMICKAASEYAPEDVIALAMTNDDHFQYLTDEYNNVVEASPVYTMKTVREKGLVR